jgi:hypothetical protein
MTTREEFECLLSELQADAAGDALEAHAGYRDRNYAATTCAEVLAVYDAQAARIAELEAACRCAEQTARNLLLGWLADDGRAIALNEVQHLRRVLGR